MKNLRNTMLITATMALLAACGDNTTDRAVSGGALGAVGGAVIGSTVGAPGTGALVGGAAGAAVGGLTSQSEIDLGKPIWR